MDALRSAFTAEIAPITGANRRTDERENVSIDARVLQDGFQRSLCKVEDISTSGARISTYTALKAKSDIVLLIPNVGIRAAAVVWANEFAAGLHFHDPLTVDEFERITG